MENIHKKTLDELLREKNNLEQEILCQEIGNDSYYLSPLCNKHAQQLYLLNQEISALRGQLWVNGETA